MNDLDHIQANQIVIMRALGMLCDRDGFNEQSDSLWERARATEAHLNAKLAPATPSIVVEAKGPPASDEPGQIYQFHYGRGSPPAPLRKPSSDIP